MAHQRFTPGEPHARSDAVRAVPGHDGRLGFGVAELGVLVAIQNLVGNAIEVIRGFLTPFLRRSYVLAFGNVVMSIGTLLTSLVGSFPGLVTTRTVYSVGASAQHPIGSSLLSGYFPRTRGSVGRIREVMK